MDLEKSFTVLAEVETAWETLLDVEAVVPCMPGVTLEFVNGDEFISSGAAVDATAPAQIKTGDSVNLLTTAVAPVLKRVVPVVIATAGATGAIITNNKR